MTTQLPKRLAFEQNSICLFVGMILLLLLLTLWPRQIYSQTVSRVGTTAATFLKIGIGGRALGMGEALSTQSRDVTAIYWNPAGLTEVNNLQVLLNHYDYIADIYYDYGAVAFSLGNSGTIGFHFAYLGMPDLERTTMLEPNGTGEMVSAWSFSSGLSYARALTDRFSIGGTFKMIQENLWHSRATGYALDIGLQYRTIFKDILIGMSISNFGTNMQLSGRDLLVQHDIDVLSEGNNSNINADLSTDKFPLPILFRVGISANITRNFMGIEGNDLIIAVDAVHPNDNFEYINTGMEYTFNDFLSLRTGYRQLFLDAAEGGFTFGFGLRLDIMNYLFVIDYAAVDFGRLDYLNKFSLMFAF